MILQFDSQFAGRDTNDYLIQSIILGKDNPHNLSPEDMITTEIQTNLVTHSQEY